MKAAHRRPGIGETVRQTGLSVDTRRYYEKIALLARIAPDSGGRRHYEARDLARLRFIQRAQRCNFSIDEIRQLVVYTAGQLAEVHVNDQGESGKPVERHFCDNCGSQILSRVHALPQVDFIKGGTLDDNSWLQPDSQFYCDTAQSWYELPERLTRYRRNPPLGE